jgi:hypothetical protein
MTISMKKTINSKVPFKKGYIKQTFLNKQSDMKTSEAPMNEYDNDDSKTPIKPKLEK